MTEAGHPDPEAPDFRAPEPAERSTLWNRASTSREMAAYRAALSLPGQPTVRAAVLDDLSVYHNETVEQSLWRCKNWQAWSIEEWNARPRDSQDAISEFYNAVESWDYDLLWYAYLQAEDVTYPTAVIAAAAAQERLPGRRLRCLDFGSGAGDLAQLLIQLGHEATLADVSRPLLKFAQWRLERRGQRASYIDLNDRSLPPDAYDVVFAKDVLVHVANYVESIRALHASLRPGGLLLATFDTRDAIAPENAWHLYQDDVAMRRTVQDLGFEQVGRLDGFLFIYRRVETAGLPHLVRRARNAVTLGPARRVVRDGKGLARRLLGR